MEDLNELRRLTSEAREETPVKTKEEEIAELEAKLIELENAPEPDTMFAAFNKLSEEDQLKEVKRVERNRGLPEGSYTIEARRKELEKDINDPSLRQVRIAAIRSKLEKLKSV